MPVAEETERSRLHNQGSAAHAEGRTPSKGRQAIAEIERLMNELRRSMLRAQQPDDRLNYLHWLRIEDARTKQ